MKILVLGLDDAYFAPMLRGFLNYYLPKEYKLFSGKKDHKPTELTIELMEDVGIDISKRLSQPAGKKSYTDFNLIITTTVEAKNHLSDFELSKKTEVKNLEYELDASLTGKAFKKHLKKARKQLQKYGEQLMEESIR
ncbi:hypothetical protein BST97_07745 [Nonlabens spongiae]|uniref:Uncharacterized protein n=1 Tax=Nonlabens spongiae TaxID=331648 RepID=A0A1W6MJX0_9FLAO|nr:hypothetical protein [Nonlabens spongiae]ARN77901.1 hypothetical protein BST97_07745 [Nonlabens spongiae]